MNWDSEVKLGVRGHCPRFKCRFTFFKIASSVIVNVADIFCFIPFISNQLSDHINPLQTHASGNPINNSNL
jgi:hypothetical protein